MIVDNILRKIPGYALDIRTNFSDIMNNELEGLTRAQSYGISVAVCYTLQNEQLLNLIRNEAKLFLEESHFEAAKAACAIMAQNNAYFNFIDIANDPDIVFQAGELNMAVLAEPKIDKTEFEMYMLAISVVNSCRYCICFHKDKLIKKGISKVAIKNIAKIAAVLKSVSQVLGIENLRVYDFFLRGEGM